MTNIPHLLTIITFLPLVGAAFIAGIRGEEEHVARNARWVALWTSGAVFLLSLLLWFGFDRSNPGFQFEERADWIPALNIAYRMGVDGISMPFVLLSTLLTPICVLASWEAIETRVKEYMIAFLVLETFMVGTFCALDFVAFYVFFEGVLIPMFIIIGVWGGARRVYSAFKFFLFTLLGSVLMLVAILTMYDQAGTTDIPTLMTTKFDPGLQIWLWLALFASFAVKVPMWPVHTWLPDAHVEAPTAGSVILAGVLLEDGRLRLPALLDPDAAGCLDHAGAAGVRAQHRRGHLHLAGRVGADRHEEADRLFVGRAYGLRHRRHLRPQPPGRRGRDDPDAEPRHRLGRAVPVRRRGL